MFQFIPGDSNFGKASGRPDFLWETLPWQLCESPSRFPTDVVRTDAGWDFLIELPGVQAKNINVEVKNAHLVITANNSAASPEKQQDGTVYRERFSGSHSRRFKLPESADTKTVSAKLSKGILQVQVLREPDHQTRQIPVKTDQDKVG